MAETITSTRRRRRAQPAIVLPDPDPLDETPRVADRKGVDVVLERLIQARKDVGLTQKELAAELHVDEMHVSRVERGTKRPSQALLDEWVTKVSTTVAYVCGLEEDGSTLANEGPPNKRKVMLSVDFRDAPEPVRRRFQMLRLDGGGDMRESQWFKALAALTELHQMTLLESVARHVATVEARPKPGK